MAAPEVMAVARSSDMPEMNSAFRGGGGGSAARGDLGDFGVVGAFGDFGVVGVGGGAGEEGAAKSPPMPS